MDVGGILFGDHLLEIILGESRGHGFCRCQSGGGHYAVAHFHAGKAIDLAVLVNCEIEEKFGRRHSGIVGHGERNGDVAAIFVINYLTVGADILALENYRFREHLAVVAGGRFP